MKTELLALIDDLVKFELYVTKGQLSAAKDAKRIRADIVFLLDKAEQAQAPAAKCETCNDNGLIGGPSFYDPGEGGGPCPDCSAPTAVEPVEQFEDARVQKVYDILCSTEEVPKGEHWEGFTARRIVDSLATTKAEPAPTGTPQIRWVADGKVYGNPTQHDLREALVVAQHCACDACKAEPADALDAARWRYAMDWDNKEFAVCKRQDMSWAPIKTSGPLDHAMVPQKD